MLMFIRGNKTFILAVPSQPLNFKAEAESETSILLSWTPPRSDTISSYELYYKEGDQAEEVICGLL